MEKVEAIRETTRRRSSLSDDGQLNQVPDVGMLAEGPKCGEPQTGNLLYRRECSLSSEKSRRGEHSICGKMDTPTLLNVPLDSDGARGAAAPAALGLAAGGAAAFLVVCAQILFLRRHRCCWFWV